MKTLFIIGLFLAVILQLGSCVVMMSIDFGSEWIKVAVVAVSFLKILNYFIFSYVFNMDFYLKSNSLYCKFYKKVVNSSFFLIILE